MFYQRCYFINGALQSLSSRGNRMTHHRCYSIKYKNTTKVMGSYAHKHLDLGPISSSDRNSNLKGRSFSSSKNSSIKTVITSVPITSVKTMSIPKEETLSMVDPVEIKIPVPWGHIAGNFFPCVASKCFNNFVRMFCSVKIYYLIFSQNLGE